jgi:hypothetical protein
LNHRISFSLPQWIATGWLLLFLLAGFGPPANAQRNVLEKLIRQNQDSLQPWAADPARYEVQILYTQIDRDEQNRPQFTTYRYGVDPKNYFYPASTVKMPVAFLALERLHDLGVRGLDRDAAMKIGADRAPQTPVVTDPSAPDLLPSVGHYVRKIFLVSDNDAYNRLYEWLGPAYISRTLREKGFGESRIIHRLSVSGFDTLGNRWLNPVTFYRGDTTLYYRGPAYQYFYDDLGLTRQVRGKAYQNSAGEIVPEPFDFRYKNFISVQDLHDMVQRIVFPETAPAAGRFRLSAADRAFVLRAMGERPRESPAPAYPDKGDNYVKFWLYGDRPEDTEIPPSIRIFNKVGWAYGYLTDASYVADFENGVEFLLTAVIHVNANETYNDGVYEYEEIGLPFFGRLGRLIYAHERERKRRHQPDLSDLRRLFAP